MTPPKIQSNYSEIEESETEVSGGKLYLGLNLCLRFLSDISLWAIKENI